MNSLVFYVVKEMVLQEPGWAVIGGDSQSRGCVFEYRNQKYNRMKDELISILRSEGNGKHDLDFVVFGTE